MIQSTPLMVAMNITGSLADVPRDLLEQIKDLEQQFTVDKAKLKEITNHFLSELERGSSRRI